MTFLKSKNNEVFSFFFLQCFVWLVNELAALDVGESSCCTCRYRQVPSFLFSYLVKEPRASSVRAEYEYSRRLHCCKPELPNIPFHNV